MPYIERLDISFWSVVEALLYASLDRYVWCDSVPFGPGSWVEVFDYILTWQQCLSLYVLFRVVFRSSGRGHRYRLCRSWLSTGEGGSWSGLQQPLLQTRYGVAYALCNHFRITSWRTRISLLSSLSCTGGSCQGESSSVCLLLVRSLVRLPCTHRYQTAKFRRSVNRGTSFMCALLLSHLDDDCVDEPRGYRKNTWLCCVLWWLWSLAIVAKDPAAPSQAKLPQLLPSIFKFWSTTTRRQPSYNVG